MYNEDMIAIEGYINFCDGFESDDETEKMKAYETYNNYFDVLDGCFEAFTIDEGKFSIATELFGGKNPFRMILDAIQAAWNWFIKKMGQLKDMLFRKKKKDDGNGNDNTSQSTDSTADVEELTKQLEELKRQKEKDNQELERLTKEMEKSVNDVREAQKSASALKEKSLQEAMAKKQAEIDSLKSRSSRLEAALSKTKSKLDQSRKETKMNKDEKRVYSDSLKKTSSKLDYSRLLNEATMKISNLTGGFQSRIKNAKRIIDDLADGVSEENIKRIDWYLDPSLDDESKDVVEAEYWIKEIKKNSEGNYSDANAAYQEKIKKYIDTSLQKVNECKNELVTYTQSIEKKRIENSEATINKILVSLQKDYLKIQDIALRISEACCYQYGFIKFRD